MDGAYEGYHGGQDGPRPRGRPQRRNATDIGTTYAYWMHQRRGTGRPHRVFEAERPTSSYITDMLPPAARRAKPADTIPAKHLHSSLNKVRQPVNAVKWTPEGRRLLTASSSGEFTLWNGTGFNFETIMQAHEESIFCVTYSHNNEWLLSGDRQGAVKYWQTNFNNVQQIQVEAPEIVIRDISFAPSDSKFVTASDDNSLKVWDFASASMISELQGHSWDVKSADWHPSKGLIASGSKDHLVKLWDPRNGKCLTTLHGHKNTLSATKFEPTNGNLLASSSREPIVRIFDLRMMRDVFLLKHESQGITSLTWHPIHSSMLSTGSQEGAITHFLLDEQNSPAGTAPTLSPYDSSNPSEAPAQTLYPAHKTPFGHENIIWSMEWHPLGHILASGGNDRVTRFWTRPRPGEDSYLHDRWHVGLAEAEKRGTWKRNEAQRQREEEEADDEMDGLIDQQMPAKQQLPGLQGLPGLPGLAARPVPSFPDGTSTGGAQQQSLPGFPNGAPPFPMQDAPPLPPGMDLEALKKAFGGQLPQLPSPGANGMPPGLPPLPFQPPANFQLPPGFPMPPTLPGVSGQAPTPSAGGAGGIRRRAPLPSQEESLQNEIRQGRYTRPR